MVKMFCGLVDGFVKRYIYKLPLRDFLEEVNGITFSKTIEGKGEVIKRFQAFGSSVYLQKAVVSVSFVCSSMT